MLVNQSPCQEKHVQRELRESTEPIAGSRSRFVTHSIHRLHPGGLNYSAGSPLARCSYCAAVNMSQRMWDAAANVTAAQAGCPTALRPRPEWRHVRRAVEPPVENTSAGSERWPRKYRVRPLGRGAIRVLACDNPRRSDRARGARVDLDSVCVRAVAVRLGAPGRRGDSEHIPVDRLKIDGVPRLGLQLVSHDLPVRPRSAMSAVDFSMRLIDLTLSTHVSAAQAAGAHMAFVETGYASTLDRSMPLELRQRLFNDGYAAAQKALAEIGAPAAATA